MNRKERQEEQVAFRAKKKRTLYFIEPSPTRILIVTQGTPIFKRMNFAAILLIGGLRTLCSVFTLQNQKYDFSYFSKHIN